MREREIMAESRWHEEAALKYHLNPHMQGEREIKIATEQEQREVAGEEEEEEEEDDWR